MQVLVDVIRASARTPHIDHLSALRLPAGTHTKDHIMVFPADPRRNSTEPVVLSGLEIRALAADAWWTVPNQAGSLGSLDFDTWQEISGCMSIANWHTTPDGLAIELGGATLCYTTYTDTHTLVAPPDHQVWIALHDAQSSLEDEVQVYAYDEDVSEYTRYFSLFLAAFGNEAAARSQLTTFMLRRGFPQDIYGDINLVTVREMVNRVAGLAKNADSSLPPRRV